MEGIERPVDRFQAFTKGLLRFGLALKPCSTVQVTVYYSKFERKHIKAIVGYIGEVEGFLGFQFGLEVLVSIFLLLIWQLSIVGINSGIYYLSKLA